MKVHLYCDESGAKGHADVPESFPGEVGIFAGILVLDSDLAQVTADLERICLPFRSADGKLHVTDLPPYDQQKLRAEIFAFLLANRLPCIYEAIHVQGFKAAHDRLIGLVEDAKQMRRSAVKISGNLNPPRLHEELFQALFAKAVEYLEDCGTASPALTITTDRVDNSILRGFEGAMKEFTGGLGDLRVTGWNPSTHAVERATIRVTEEMPPEWQIHALSTGQFDVRLDTQQEPLVVAADVLANSLNYFFSQRTGAVLGTPLLTTTAIAGHPLAPIFFGLPAPDGYPNPSDVLYQHPLESQRIHIRTFLQAAPSEHAVRTELYPIINARAGAIWLETGGTHGHHNADWFQAREELDLPPEVSV